MPNEPNCCPVMESGRRRYLLDRALNAERSTQPIENLAHDAGIEWQGGRPSNGVSRLPALMQARITGMLRGNSRNRIAGIARPSF